VLIKTRTIERDIEMGQWNCTFGGAILGKVEFLHTIKYIIASINTHSIVFIVAEIVSGKDKPSLIPFFCFLHFLVQIPMLGTYQFVQVTL